MLERASIIAFSTIIGYIVGYMLARYQYNRKLKGFIDDFTKKR